MIALIPARGGSKGLPGKNIKLFAGQPLIAHSIAAARTAKSIERVVVDTDDQAIADIARAHGAEVPYLRPADLATDTASAVDVYLHASQQLASEALCVLLPTAPLRLPKDIDHALQIFHQQQADAVISICESAVPPSWLRAINSQGVLVPWQAADDHNHNRQQCGQAYVPNGAIFALRIAYLKTSKTYYGPRTYPYIMPRERSIDIDDSFDFALAEWLFQRQEPHQQTPSKTETTHAS